MCEENIKLMKYTSDDKVSDVHVRYRDKVDEVHVWW